jgi:metallo-beta-lactamase family protein
LKGFKKQPQKTFVVHGEPHAAENFANVIKNELNWEHVTIAKHGDLYPI